MERLGPWAGTREIRDGVGLGEARAGAEVGGEDGEGGGEDGEGGRGGGGASTGWRAGPGPGGGARV